MSKKKTHEEYVAEVAIKNPDIEVVGFYSGATKSILHRCTKHGFEWNAFPTNILRGHGCPTCGGNRKKAHEQYVKEVEEINEFIYVIGEYINARTPIAHKCKIDEYVWNVAPYVILRGDGCPKCAKNAKKTTESYIEELSFINPNIEVLGEYIGANTKILHRCKIDKNEWLATPANILFGCGCPKCKLNKLSNMFAKSHSEYVRQLSVINSDLEVIEKYINAKMPILHRCKIDGYEWKIAPGNALSGQGCPQCQESKGERQIRQWLDNNNITYVYQKSFDDCKDKKLLPFDFYLPDFNTLIEFDGRQHFEPVDFSGDGQNYAIEQLSIIRNHDKIKTDYCKSNNIPLLRIPYFKNIEEELNNFIHLI